MKVTVIIAIIMCLIKLNQGFKEATKRVCDTSVSDFYKIVKTSAFVDKTLMIKTIFEKQSVLLITAPRRFGKSTNMNMIKRFLEINVNSKGKLKDKKTTKNYKLFNSNALKICQHTKFFNQHFGNHPVVFIDYKPLREITSFNSMLDSFKIVLRKTYLQHEYLVHKENLWSGSLSINKFRKYIDLELNESLTPLDIKQGFTYLSEILFKHFKKQVFVLIDEYDAYVDSMIFRNNSELDSIIIFVQGINNDLLKSNEYLDRALLTGVLRVTGPELSTPGNNIKEYSFLRDHPFSDFYGVTQSELDELLNKFIKNTTELEETKSIIRHYYSGYTIMKRTGKLFSIWSIICFLENNRKAISYWCTPEYVHGFLPIFSLDKIQERIEDLLSGETIVLDITTPLSKQDIISLNGLSNSNNANEQQVLCFFYFLFELGYLSIHSGKSKYYSSINVEIPNLEIRLEFAHMLRQVYIKRYDISLHNINIMNSIINSVCPETGDYRIFIDISKSLNILFSQSKYWTSSKKNFRSIILVSLMTRFHSSRSKVYNPMPPGYMDILFHNHNGVYFIIEIKQSLSTDKAYREQIAINGHKEIILKGYINYLDPNSRNKVVYLSISYSSDKAISISYSYFLKEGDNLGNTRLVR